MEEIVKSLENRIKSVEIKLDYVIQKLEHCATMPRVKSIEKGILMTGKIQHQILYNAMYHDLCDLIDDDSKMHLVRELAALYSSEMVKLIRRDGSFELDNLSWPLISKSILSTWTHVANDQYFGNRMEDPTIEQVYQNNFSDMRIVYDTDELEVD